MVVRLGHDEKQEVVDALEGVHHGEPYAKVARPSSFPLSSLFKKMQDQQSGIPIEGLRRGTKPKISADLESHLVKWIASMRRVSLPFAHIEIMKRAILTCDALQKRTKASQSTQITYGWYSCFLDCHRMIVPRTAQSIRRVRNAVGKSLVDVLFNTLAKLIIDHTIDSSWALTCTRLHLRRSPRPVPSLPLKAL